MFFSHELRRFFNAKFILNDKNSSEQRMNQQVDLIKLCFQASRSKFYLPLPSTIKSPWPESLRLHFFKTHIFKNNTKNNQGISDKSLLRSTSGCWTQIWRRENFNSLVCSSLTNYVDFLTQSLYWMINIRVSKGWINKLIWWSFAFKLHEANFICLCLLQ